MNKFKRPSFAIDEMKHNIGKFITYTVRNAMHNINILIGGYTYENGW